MEFSCVYQTSPHACCAYCDVAKNAIRRQRDDCQYQNAFFTTTLTHTTIKTSIEQSDTRSSLYPSPPRTAYLLACMAATWYIHARRTSPRRRSAYGARVA